MSDLADDAGSVKVSSCVAAQFTDLAPVRERIIVESMTIDELVAVSRRELESIRDEMATREELKATEDNILRAIERLGNQVSVYASRWNSEFERFADNVQNIENRIRARDASA